MATVVPIGQLVGEEAIAETELLRDQARDAANDAEAAAAAVAPGVANGTAQLDATAKVREAQVPSRLSASTLAAQFPSRTQFAQAVWPVGPKRLFAGDSITNGSSASGTETMFVTQTGVLAGTEINRPIRQGFPGERADQIAARLPGLITTHTPDSVHFQAGTNDAGQGRTTAEFIAAVDAAFLACVQSGIPFTTGTVFPRGASFADHARITGYNLALRDWAARRNVPLAETFSALADPLTGYMRAAFDSGDAVHPNSAGHTAIAQAIAVMLGKGARRTVWPVMAKQPGNLLPSPLNDNAAAWTLVGGSGGVGTLVPASGDLTAGQWRQYVLDNTAGASQINYTVGQIIDQSQISVGDVLRMVAKVEVESDGVAQMHAQISRSATNVSRPFAGATSTPLSGLVSDYTVQAADIGVNMRWGMSLAAPAGSKVTARMGQLGVFNLTKLGVV